jgi:predicted PhzF superfamily epimerase YddE/YHI9
MDFPTERIDALEMPFGLGPAMGAKVLFFGRGPRHYLAELTSAAEVREFRPPLDLIAKLPGQGLIVTALADDDRSDFISRYFAPAMGVPEDPVTGSAHCALGAFWQQRLGRSAMRGYQASSRGGLIELTNLGERTQLCGKGVTIMRGELML